MVVPRIFAALHRPVNREGTVLREDGTPLRHGEAVWDTDLVEAFLRGLVER